VDLFVIDRTRFSDLTPSEAAQFGRADGLTTATWARGGKTYLLTSSADESVIRKRREAARWHGARQALRRLRQDAGRMLPMLPVMILLLNRRGLTLCFCNPIIENALAGNNPAALYLSSLTHEPF
jgi:hypothetical protein